MTQEWRSNRIEPFPKPDTARAEPPAGLIELLLDSVIAVGTTDGMYFADFAPRRTLSREEFEFLMMRGARDAR